MATATRAVARRRTLYSIDLESADGTTLEATVHPASRASRRPATIVAAHDLGMDMDEGGMYLRLAERLAPLGVTTLRFSFRGHGGSGGSQRALTVAGLMVDLTSAVTVATVDYPGDLYLMASGFAAVPTSICLPNLPALAGLVLWQPVLDLRETFVEPRLPWGQSNFGAPTLLALERDGFALVDGEFAFGLDLFREMSQHDPIAALEASRVATLIVHGGRDARASHDTAAAVAAGRAECQFHSIHGAGRGFDATAHEDEALDVTTRWIVQRVRDRA